MLGFFDLRKVKKPKHVLVFRLSAMGDVAMTVPVLAALTQQYPEVKITMVSRPFFEPFFTSNPNVRFFGIDLKQRHKGFFGLIRLFLDLKKLDIDAVADLHNVLRSKVIRFLFALSGKKTAATNKGRKGKKELTRAENKIFKPLPTMFENHVATFEKLGFTIDLSQPQFPKPIAISKQILDLLNLQKEFATTKNIGIAPFAQYDSKVYPLDLMQQIIDLLASNKGYQIYLFGGGNHEIEKLNQLKSTHQNVIVLAGKLAFKDEITIISNLDVMLSMDSGNSHIAAMLGKKVITLWGATHPFAGFMPFNQPFESVITSNRAQFPLLPTSVYGNKQVAGYEEAMRSISPNEVVATLEKALDN